MPRRFSQVDVFATGPFTGNPVAVVLDGAGLGEEEMSGFARWTNVAETTFILAPEHPEADYRLRIFTPVRELPFAGHPTLGSAHAWLQSGGVPRREGVIVQECAAGLVRLRKGAETLAFAAPALVRSGPVDEALLARIAAMLRIGGEEIVDAQWVDNGPGWVAVLLRDAQAVLALEPGPIELDLGAVGAHPPGSEDAFEVRAFVPDAGALGEDPVTGSLNASLATWLLASGRAHAPYTVRQGTAIGRAGRVHISADPDGTVWVAGETVTRISGQVEL